MDHKMSERRDDEVETEEVVGSQKQDAGLNALSIDQLLQQLKAEREGRKAAEEREKILAEEKKAAEEREKILAEEKKAAEE